MIFSKSCKAALKSLAYLAFHIDDEKVYSIKELCVVIEDNDHTLAKVLQLLAKSDMISSIKGPHGGFYLEKKHLKISILNIVEAVDGKLKFNQCAMGFSKCNSKKPCAFHHDFKRSRKIIETMLLKRKVEDLGKTENGFSTI